MPLRNSKLETRNSKLDVERRRRSNVVLIGLPAAGKSTLGVLLAKRLSLDFVDTDVVLQARTGRRLQDILDEDGVGAFRRLEEVEILGLVAAATVVATGGSVIYSTPAMQHLRRGGTLVYLYLTLAQWQERLQNFGDRGVVRAPDQSFESLYAEREPLYRRWAEVVVDTGGLGHEAAVERIAAALSGPAR